MNGRMTKALPSNWNWPTASKTLRARSTRYWQNHRPRRLIMDSPNSTCNAPALISEETKDWSRPKDFQATTIKLYPIIGLVIILETSYS